MSDHDTSTPPNTARKLTNNGRTASSGITAASTRVSPKARVTRATPTAASGRDGITPPTARASAIAAPTPATHPNPWSRRPGHPVLTPPPDAVVLTEVALLGGVEVHFSRPQIGARSGADVDGGHRLDQVMAPSKGGGTTRPVG